MALQNEIWVQDIQKVLFQSDLSWLEFGTNHDSYAGQALASGYRTVNIPQATSFAAGTNVDYSSTLPRTVAKRTDSILSYTINIFDTGVIAYQYSDALQVSYDLRASIITQQIEEMAQKIGTEILAKWAVDSLTASSDRSVATSGVTASLWNESGQTGVRKQVSITDIQRLSRILDLDNMPQSDRYLIMPSSLYIQLFQLDEVKNSIAFYGFQRGNTLPEKSLPQLFGFSVIMRPTVLAYASTGAIKSSDAYGLYTLAATDNIAALAFHKSAVAKANGGIQAYQGIQQDPLMSGGQSLLAVVAMGAAKLRSDSKGVAVLYQGT
jgi:hypothetical protein